MNKLLTDAIQVALLAATLSGTSACAEERRQASIETANQMCVIIDDKLVCAPMAEAALRVVSSEFG